MTEVTRPASLLVIGSGLIGASVGLALRDVRRVLLHDADAESLQAAVARGAGEAWDGRETADLVLVAVPPRRTAAALNAAQRRDLGSTYTHVASVQSAVQRHLESLGSDVSTVCGGHPLAGREVSGPAGASAELFLGRPWVACPSAASGAAALLAVTELAAACGAEPLVMAPDEHDRAVALNSHLPQIASSALAAGLLGSDTRSASASGPGLQDTTRIAASDPTLWTDVLAANSAHLAPLAAALAGDLQRLAEALEQLAMVPEDVAALAVVRDLLTRGQAGRGLVPVKSGLLDRDLAVVAVRVPDEPGRLAQLFIRAAEVGVNVEDVRVEHLPGRRTGVVELLVRTGDRDLLQRALATAGLEVHR